jgi:hypothetical protein
MQYGEKNAAGRWRAALPASSYQRAFCHRATLRDAHHAPAKNLIEIKELRDFCQKVKINAAPQQKRLVQCDLVPIIHPMLHCNIKPKRPRYRAVGVFLLTLGVSIC